MHAHDDTQIFDRAFRVWVQKSCREWNFELPPESYYSEVFARFPVGLQTTLEFGYKKGLLVDAGKSNTGSAGFRLKGVPESKGAYSWFEKDSQKKQPRPAWECLIQVAEYVRLYETLREKDYVLTLEDNLMDIALYRDSKLIICCAIKEQLHQAKELVEKIKEYGHSLDFTLDDRGHDALRKAKYIIKFKPDYFYVLSIGGRFEYQITHPREKTFRLSEDIIPFI
ncbi:MAG: hypothetical protein P8075_01575 [Deltaproteobacteria bacterium]|jgi:hypothetical protein